MFIFGCIYSLILFVNVQSITRSINHIVISLLFRTTVPLNEFLGYISIVNLAIIAEQGLLVRHRHNNIA